MKASGQIGHLGGLDKERQADGSYRCSTIMLDYLISVEIIHSFKVVRIISSATDFRCEAPEVIAGPTG
jgi:hypothetical protein